MGVNVRDYPFDIDEAYRIFSVNQISDQKTGPSVTGSGKRNKECVIWKNSQAASRAIRPQYVFDKVADPGFH